MTISISERKNVREEIKKLEQAKGLEKEKKIEKKIFDRDEKYLEKEEEIKKINDEGRKKRELEKLELRKKVDPGIKDLKTKLTEVKRQNNRLFRGRNMEEFRKGFKNESTDELEEYSERIGSILDDSYDFYTDDFKRVLKNAIVENPTVPDATKLLKIKRQGEKIKAKGHKKENA